VWKQFALIGIFLLLGLVLLGGVAAFAAAPQLVAPPALVPGDRLVLPASDIPVLGGPPKRVGPPWLGASRQFWLAQPARGEFVAILATWPQTPAGADSCTIDVMGPPQGAPVEQRWYIAHCPDGHAPTFNGRGEPIDKGAPRGLDRYLVSVSDDRVIVNLSRLIVSPERTSAPPSP
jgi:hypothetical protein